MRNRDSFGCVSAGAAVVLALPLLLGGCDDEPSSGSGTGGASSGAGGVGAIAGAGGNGAEDGEAVFRSFVEQTMEEEEIPGLAVAIVQGDSTVFSRGYGLADIEAEVLATADTPFTIASVSKTFVATAMMQAIERGTVSMDTPINDTGMPFQVDNPLLEGEAITLRHLATHTSGILDADGYDCSYYIEENTSPLLALVEPSIACADPMPTELGDYLVAYFTEDGSYYDHDNFSADDPGESWAYSNVGAALTAYALESATDTSFVQLCEDGIFEPLGMENTHWHRSDFAEPSLIAAQYTTLDGNRIRIPDYSLATWPDGGLRASANDLARFVGAIMNGGIWDGNRILQEDSVAAMLSSQTDAAVLEEGTEVQGIFWVQGAGVTGHTGGDPGSSSAVFFAPDTDTAIVFVANQDFDGEVYTSLAVRLFEFAERFAE